MSANKNCIYIYGILLKIVDSCGGGHFCDSTCEVKKNMQKRQHTRNCFRFGEKNEFLSPFALAGLFNPKSHSKLELPTKHFHEILVG